MNKHRLKEYISLGSILIAWLILIHLVYLMIYPYEPLIINNVKIFKDHYRVGDSILYEVDYCKNIDGGAMVTKNFEDGIIFMTKSYYTNIDVGCNTKNISVLIPNTLPEGNYKLSISAEYNVNLLRDVTIRYDTPNFEVIE